MVGSVVGSWDAIAVADHERKQYFLGCEKERPHMRKTIVGPASCLSSSYKS